MRITDVFWHPLGERTARFGSAIGGTSCLENPRYVYTTPTVRAMRNQSASYGKGCWNCNTM